MTSQNFSPTIGSLLHLVRSALHSFPAAYFSLALLTDIAYWQTSNLLWLYFSEWLLLAGLVFGVIAIFERAMEFLLRRARRSWCEVTGGLIVLVLATVNSLVHTADGWTAVVPNGLILSVVTVLAMIVTAWLARAGLRDV